MLDTVKMPRTTCGTCKRNIAALPGGGPGQWRLSRHDAPHDGTRREELVSCSASLRPVELDALDFQLPLPQEESELIVLF
ncbi:hypothetical protein P3T29_000603 [Kitasatospora sp. MAP5-34]|nr:hypothetical protein [Kitasatospora sp. MAP5-34]